MWPLFVGIAVGFLLLLSFVWGVATGTRLGKKSQARAHEAFRAAADQALLAHRLEREAWLARRVEGPHALDRQLEIAERAHTHTRAAFLALAPAWGDDRDASGPSSAEPGRTAADQAKPAT